MTKRNLTAGLFCGAVVLVGLAAWASTSASTAEPISLASPSDTAFWRQLGPPEGAVETEHYTSLRALADGASVVLEGQIIDVVHSRTIGPPDDPEDRVHFGAAVIHVIDVLNGALAAETTPDGRTVLVEFMVPEPVTPDIDVGSLPQGRALFFLRQKGSPIPGYGRVTSRVDESRWYRFVNSQGLFVEQTGGLAFPLRTSSVLSAEELSRQGSGDQPSTDSPQLTDGAYAHVGTDEGFLQDIESVAFTDVVRCVEDASCADPTLVAPVSGGCGGTGGLGAPMVLGVPWLWWIRRRTHHSIA